MKSMLRSIPLAVPDRIESVRACELGRLIEEAMAAVLVARRKKDILFAWTTGHDDLQVLVDPVKGARLIAAVLANAIDRSPNRGVVTLDIRPGEEGIGLAITDQGPRTQGGSAAPGQGLLIAVEFKGSMEGSVIHLPVEDDGATCLLMFMPA